MLLFLNKSVIYLLFLSGSRHAKTCLRAYANREGPVSLRTESLDTTECINGKCPDETLRMRVMNLNLCI